MLAGKEYTLRVPMDRERFAWYMYLSQLRTFDVAFTKKDAPDTYDDFCYNEFYEVKIESIAGQTYMIAVPYCKSSENIICEKITNKNVDSFIKAAEHLPSVIYVKMCDNRDYPF